MQDITLLNAIHGVGRGQCKSLTQKNLRANTISRKLCFLSALRSYFPEDIAISNEVWYTTGIKLDMPFRLRTGRIELEYVNKRLESLRRTEFFYVSTGKPGRELSVIHQVAAPREGSARVYLRTKSALSIGWQCTTLTRGITPFLIGVPLPLLGGFLLPFSAKFCLRKNLSYFSHGMRLHP